MSSCLWFNSQKLTICENTIIVLPYIFYVSWQSLITLNNFILCTGKLLCSFYRQRIWGPEKLKDLSQVTQQAGSRTSNRTQIGSRTLSIILSYLPYDTMKLEKKIFHGPGLTNTTSSLSPTSFLHHAATSWGIYIQKNPWGVHIHCI